MGIFLAANLFYIYILVNQQNPKDPLYSVEIPLELLRRLIGYVTYISIPLKIGVSVCDSHG